MESGTLGWLLGVHSLWLTLWENKTGLLLIGPNEVVPKGLSQVSATQGQSRSRQRAPPHYPISQYTVYREKSLKGTKTPWCVS